jgi:hypothetical protein
LIQKSQTSIFVKYLNLSEFENVSHLNLNFEFLFKLVEKKLRKQFYIPLAAHAEFGPLVVAARSFFLSFFVFLSCKACQLASPLGLPAQLGPPSPVVVSVQSVCATAVRLLFASRRPEVKCHRIPFTSPNEPTSPVQSPSPFSFRDETDAFKSPTTGHRH